MTITNNLIEYNTEGIGIHWLTNSSLVKDNIVRYNQKYGIFIQKHSFNNTVEDNVVIGNNKGIGLLDDSNNNLIQSNIVANNIQADVHTDPDSQSNIVKNIVNQIQDVNGLNSRINWFHNVLGKSWGVDK